MKLNDTTNDIATDVNFGNANLDECPIVNTIFSHFEGEISWTIGLDNIKAACHPCQLHINKMAKLST